MDLCVLEKMLNPLHFITGRRMRCNYWCNGSEAHLKILVYVNFYVCLCLLKCSSEIPFPYETVSYITFTSEAHSQKYIIFVTSKSSKEAVNNLHNLHESNSYISYMGPIQLCFCIGCLIFYQVDYHLAQNRKQNLYIFLTNT